MIVDTSALVAIILNESDAPKMATAITNAVRPLMSAANWLEASIVLVNRGGPELGNRLDAFVATLDIEVVPVTHAMAAVARTAHLRFGKGRHPARLNFGDCMAYALAKTSSEPLLFKGNDFAQTDITPALLQ